MKNHDKHLDNRWKFSFKKSADNFYYENENFSLNLMYSFCLSINSPERTFSQPMHKNAYYELHMVLDGSFRYETEDKEVFEVKKGDFVLHPPGFRHRIISETPVFSKIAISFYFSPKETASAFYHIAEKLGNDNRVLQFSKQMYTIYETILQLANEKPYEYKSSFFFLTISLIIEMFRVVVGKEKLDMDIKYNDHRINNAIDFITSNISAKLKVPDVAKHLHMSTRQFTKIFTETVGVSPGMYIKNYRIKYICDLLVNSDLSINDIVNILAYPDSAALIKAFKRVKGVTPLKYRKTYNKKI